MTTGEDPRFTRFQPVPYTSLNSRGKENRNFAKVSAVLCDYGFATVRLSDDYRGADFLAIHPDGTILRCQLKGRISIAKKYLEAEDLWIVFPAPNRNEGDAFYVVPHDVLVAIIGETTPALESAFWKDSGSWSTARPSKKILDALAPFLYEPVRIDRFTWQPGDFEIIGTDRKRCIIDEDGKRKLAPSEPQRSDD